MGSKRNIGSFLFSYLFIFSLTLSAQDKKLADSLKIVYHQGVLSGDDKLELLRNLAFNTTDDFEASIRFANELIELSKERKNYVYLYRGYSQKGQTYRLAGELLKALNAFITCGEIALKIEDKSYLGVAYLTIADVYSEIGNSGNANQYYKRSIDILRQSRDTISLASALLNAGEEASKNNEYIRALQYFNESGALYKQINYPTGIAYNEGNVGMVYAKQGLDDKAEKHIHLALSMLEEQGDHYASADYLTYMSDIYLRRNDFPSALKYAQQSLKLAYQNKLKEQLSSTYLTLSKIYEKQGDAANSLENYKAHIRYRDSLINLDNVQKLADQRTNFEVSLKQTEVDLLEQKRKNQRIVTLCITGAFFLAGVIAFLWYRRYRFIKNIKHIIEEEKERSDQLLLNILPVETASELKQNGKVKAKKFEAVTVLFADFKGFSSYSKDLSPEKLVETVDHYFSHFDAILDKYDIEKIKTIGDAYMCASGLHDYDNAPAHRMIKAAIEILNFVEDTKKDFAFNNLSFDIRIGINSGPVVAGVVGTKKFAFDIWGDTVNVAARMETNSEPGKINLSENTYELIKDAWSCQYRGEIEVKNRGQMKMYFLEP